MSCQNGNCCRNLESGKSIVGFSSGGCSNDGSFVSKTRCCIIFLTIVLVCVGLVGFLTLLAQGKIDLQGGTVGAPGHKRASFDRDLSVSVFHGNENSSSEIGISDEFGFDRDSIYWILVPGVILLVSLVVTFVSWIYYKFYTQHIRLNPESSVWGKFINRACVPNAREFMSYFNDNEEKHWFKHDSGFEFFVMRSEPYNWHVNAEFGSYLVARWDRHRGCLLLDLDNDVPIMKEWAKIFGIGLSLSIIGNEFLFTGPVVWSIKYADHITLASDIRLLIDLDHYGEKIISHGEFALGFCSPQFNFKAISISVIKTMSYCRSATDIQMYGFIFRTGELGLLIGKQLTVLSKDKVFESAKDIIQIYSGL